MSTTNPEPHCPMCGESVSAGAEACPACGEPLKDEQSPLLQVSDRFLLKKFRLQMNALAVIWYVTGGVITSAVGTVWVAALIERRLPGFYWTDNVYLGLLTDGLVTAFSFEFLLTAIACRRRQEWGLYGSLINGYCALAINLLLFRLFFNVCGIALVIPILILCHLAQRTARQLKEAGIPLDHQF